ncbi:MAG: hypothetical protein A3K60_00985 [Euryarchaeota archaeon RBG_19FT_COMBO_56_21]|nr:MAG: hypothetical protein A3K60_00985 [Euryarchaeota archaeon RBG_19FT_COMBO_56_21]
MNPRSSGLPNPRYKLSKRAIDAFWDLMVMVKYPKIGMLALVVIFAYLTFRLGDVQSFFHSLGQLGYVSAFLGGMLFAFGFGAPFGVAILATIADDVNILVAGLVGGLGALLSDYILFKFIRVTFNDEILRFKSSRAFSFVDGALIRKLPPRLSFYIILGVAGFVIASPLPDEIGVAMLAGIATVRDRTFAVMSFALNTLGILVVLAAGAVL